MTDTRAPGEGTTQMRRRRGGRGEISMVPEMRPTSYYGRPVIKRPVWTPEVAVYLFTGGLAGGASMLTVTARRLGNDRLARRSLFTAVAAAGVSPVLLIADLGVPRRFYNMLRVVKPTSPMNIGSWILTGAGGALGVAAASELTGLLPGLGRVAETSAGVLGPALSTYTAVLLSDTAVPVWHQAHTELPFVFGASAMASAGAAGVLLTDPEHAGPARTLAIGGMLAELGSAQLMQRRLGEIAEPYRHGGPARFAKLAKGLGAAGAALLAVAGRRRGPAMLGGAAVFAASFCERWAIYRAGTASAEDPRFTVEPQRQRLEQRGG